MIIQTVHVDRVGDHLHIRLRCDEQDIDLMVDRSVGYAIGRLITLRAEGHGSSVNDDALHRLIEGDAQ